MRHNQQQRTIYGISTTGESMTLPVERVREILGSQADGKSDAEIQRLAEGLDAAASRFYDDIQAAWKRDPESVRWLIHAHETGETE